MRCIFYPCHWYPFLSNPKQQLEPNFLSLFCVPTNFWLSPELETNSKQVFVAISPHFQFLLIIPFFSSSPSLSPPILLSLSLSYLLTEPDWLLFLSPSLSLTWFITSLSQQVGIGIESFYQTSNRLYSFCSHGRKRTHSNVSQKYLWKNVPIRSVVWAWKRWKGKSLLESLRVDSEKEQNIWKTKKN